MTAETATRPRRTPRAPLKKVENERGLYMRVGSEPPIFWGCATPRGSRTAAWECFGAVDGEEARDLLGAFRVAVRQGRLPLAQEREVAPEAAGPLAFPTFEAVGEMLLVEVAARVKIKELRPKTLEQHDTNLRLHCDRLLPVAIDQVGDNLVEWLENEFIRPSWTRKNHWGTVRAVLGIALRDRVIDVNPADHVDRSLLPKQAVAPRWLERAELDALIDCADTDFDEDLIIILGGTGVRQGEARGLRAASIDAKNGKVIVSSQIDRANQPARLKTDRSRREIYTSDVVIERLLRRAATAPSGGPLLTVDGVRPVSPSRMASGIAKAAARAGLRDVTCHTLRHTFASMLIARRRSGAYVSDQLGHSSPVITYRIYTHLFDRAREAKRARKGLDKDFRRFRLT